MRSTISISGTGVALDKGVQFLREHQFHHGEFCVYMGEGEHLEKWCIPDSATFYTATICTSLLPLRNDPNVQEIFRKAGDFLKYNMMRGGAWNTFTNWHKLFPLCPPDIDTTACVSYFLKQIKYPFPDNQGLIWANRNSEGLFYTWYTLRLRDLIHFRKTLTHWKLLLREFKHPLKSLLLWLKGHYKKNDIDAAVNANVLFYLGKDHEPPSVVEYLIKVIRDGKEAESDKWYRNPLELYYVLGRAYAESTPALGAVRDLIIARILAGAQPDGRLGSLPADTAMGLITLIHFNYSGEELEAGIRYLMRTQSSCGSWQMQALCFTRSEIVWGSEELSTGFCIEALARYNSLKTKNGFLSRVLAAAS